MSCQREIYKKRWQRRFPGWLPDGAYPMLPGMFDTIKSGITTATDKLTHLRRFL
jgi:hypothetical protein